jgi:hypothetical protein
MTGTISTRTKPWAFVFIVDWSIVSFRQLVLRLQGSIDEYVRVLYISTNRAAQQERRWPSSPDGFLSIPNA